jgi:hypothetical protein
MAYKGLAVDDVRIRKVSEAQLEETDFKLSLPKRSVFSDFPVNEGNFIHSSVTRMKDTHEELDEIQTERARYLLNIDDALIELLE